MNHTDIDMGTLRAFMDAELDPAQSREVTQHLESCSECRAELDTLCDHAARACDGIDLLPVPAASDARVATAWAAFQRQRDAELDTAPSRWTPFRIASLAGAGLAIASLVVVLTVAPVRAWAQSLLAVFRVEHFTILELDGSANAGLQNNQMLNQQFGRILSDEVTVTQAPQKPQPITDPATASKLAGFDVKLLTSREPTALALENGAAAQMKLDRDRLQSILDEAGRGDLRIPASADGATFGFRIPSGVISMYGNCGDSAANLMGKTQPAGHTPVPSDATCIRLMQLPSPTVSAPAEIDPAQLAQVALQLVGMSANDAANFTQTVDWTTTLVLPVLRGQSSYEQLPVNGNEGVLLRHKRAGPSDSFTLMWVDSGIVYGLSATGDDTTALNLAGELQ